MANILRAIRKNWIYLIPFILLVLFIFSIWDVNYYIGGDFIFPLKPQDNILRTLSTWDIQNGGRAFFNYVLFLWEGVFYIISLFNVPPYLSIKIFILLIYVLGFVCMFLLYRELFKETKYGEKKYALLATLFFLLNPVAVLVVVGTLPLYGIPICLFLLIKYLNTKNVLYGILFSFSLGLSYFPDLPQAKLLLVFSVTTLLFLLLYSIVRKVSIKSLVAPLLFLGIMTFLLNAFLLIPFIYGMLGEKGLYQNYTSTVTVYNGDADLLSASLPYITRFFNSNLINKNTELGIFLGSPTFSLWTFFLLGIGILCLLLVRDKNEKKIVYLCFAAFLLFVFIAKGANPPFGELYRWLLYNVPVFKLFRTTATVMIGATVFYAILLSIAVHHLSRRFPFVYIVFLLIHVLSFYPIYLGYKIETRLGGNVQQKGVSIPNEYFEMGERLNVLPEDGKILVLPLNDGYISKDWGYFGQSPITWLTKKALIVNNNTIDNSLDTRTKDELCSFASIYNVRYLLIEKDTTSSSLKKEIEFPGKKIMENQYFRLIRTVDTCFLPHFYIPTQSGYFKGNIQEIKSLPYLPEYNSDSFTHFDDRLLPESDLIVVEKAPDNNIFDLSRGYSNLDLGQDGLIQDVFYPNVSINPGSPLYPLILWKEGLGIKNDKQDKRQLLDLQIIYALKRISEIDRWGVGNSWWKNSQMRYQATISDAIQTALQSEHVKDNLELIYEYLEKSEEKIIAISETGPFWNKEKINSWRAMFEKLKKDTRSALKIPNYNTLSYSFDVPSIGNYHLYFVDLQGKQLDIGKNSYEISLNNKKLNQSLKTNRDNGISVDAGEVTLDNITNQVQLAYTNKENLIDETKWIVGDQVNKVQTDAAKIVFAPNQLNGYYISMNQIAYQDVKGWEKNGVYLLTIHHTDKPGATLRLMVRQKYEVYDRNSDSWVAKEANIIDEHLNTMPSGGVSQVLLKAHKNATHGWIYLYVAGGSITVDSVWLEKISTPRLFLVKNEQSQKKELPTIRFKQDSQTKYTVTIDNFTKPTYVVFSEGFDPGWKIYAKEDVFLPESRHFRANGYANAWYVTPNDIEGKKSRNQFTVEYIPQRNINLGQTITIVSLIVFLLYFTYTRLKKKQYN